MNVRPAVATDLPAVRAVDAEAFGADAWSAAVWQGEWDGVPALRHLVVAVDDDRVAGFGVLATVAGVADLHRVAVLSAWRRRGLGAALVEALIDEARRRECTRMLLEVEAGNAAAVALYDRLGFTEIARRDAHYGAGRDALVLELGLG
jgi:[ribosomal protein S18]-alanine N-acetyltransferase